MRDNKICPKCQINKSCNNFYTDKSKKDKLSSSCKECTKNRIKLYYIDNKEKIIKYVVEYNRQHPQYRKAICKKWDLEHPDYKKNKKKIDPNFKLKVTLRSRLNTAIKRKYKSGSAVRDLGCTIEELKVYLESKFIEGMNWNNHSKTGWHIDHILPLSKFDLTNREELVKAVHYTNLQPLWAFDNLSKGAK